MPTTITWRAHGQTIIAETIDRHGRTYRAGHDFPRNGSPALFWMLIDTLAREVADHAR